MDLSTHVAYEDEELTAQRPRKLLRVQPADDDRCKVKESLWRHLV